LQDDYVYTFVGGDIGPELNIAVSMEITEMRLEC
jgi:hypothetical protein